MRYNMGMFLLSKYASYEHSVMYFTFCVTLKTLDKNLSC